MKVLFNPQINERKYGLPTFNAMKKSQFHGIDRFVVEQTKAPIETYDGIENFYKFCADKVTTLIEKLKKGEFVGRQEETTLQREDMLSEWFNYVTKENGAYTSSIQWMILNAITKDLKKDNDKIPPILSKGALADTVYQMQEELKINEKAQFNFNYKYELNLKKNIFNGETVNDANLNGWIMIPSKKHDSKKNFEKNVEKLKTLSHHNWCTKSYNAEPYLSEGDFHIYMEKGKPILGVRFIGDVVEEIQGPRNNTKIPIKYSSIAVKFLKDLKESKGLKLSDTVKEELKTLQFQKPIVNRIHRNFPKGINNYSAGRILMAVDIPCRTDKDGMVIASRYSPNNKYCISFNDIGINENRLFKYIRKIEGGADLMFSQVNNLGNLEFIGDDLWLGSSVKSLGKLKYVGGDVWIGESKFTPEDFSSIEIKGKIHPY